MAYIEGHARDQALLLPASVEDYVPDIATGTIEEKILTLQQRKAALADTLWSENVASPAHLTEDDITYLLG